MMVNPKKTWDWCLKKPLNPMTIISIKKKKLKPNKMFTAKSSKQKDIKHASRAKNSKQTKSVPKRKFYDQNRQWNYAPTSKPFPSYGSPISMPWGADFSLLYSCAPWFYNSYMPFLPIYLCPNYITYRELAISKPSPTNNGLCRKGNTR